MKKFGLLLSVMAPMALPLPAVASDIIYRELFTHTSTNGTGTQTNAAALGWQMYAFGSGPLAKDQTISRMFIGKPLSGYPQVGLTSVNNAVIFGADSNQMYGRVGIQADVGAGSVITDNLFWTDEYTSAVTAPISTVDSISWYGSPGSSLNTANLQVRLAIRDGANNWFVSANTFDNSNKGCVPFSGDNSIVTITNGNPPAILYDSGPLASMTWNTLTWDAGYALTIGGAGTPTGDLTAVGLFNVGNTDNRADTFTITVAAAPVPEPGTLGLLVGGAIGLSAFRKRK